jgi:hypothetical protein
MELEIFMLSEISPAQKVKYHFFTPMRNLDLKMIIIMMMIIIIIT